MSWRVTVGCPEARAPHRHSDAERHIWTQPTQHVEDDDEQRAAVGSKKTADDPKAST